MTTHADSATVTHTVTAQDTAESLGSGDQAVLGTPALLAWCEEATLAALSVEPEKTSVGTKATINHVAPSGVGATISVTATVVLVAGRTISFEVAAVDQDGHTIGYGQLQRALVDRARFMARVSG